MKIRIFRILAFPLAILLIPYSFIMWVINGKEQISNRLMDYAILNCIHKKNDA